MPQVWSRVLQCAVLLSAAMTICGAPTAQAHTVLLSSDPAADSTVLSAPQRVSATFNEDLQSAFAAMTVVGPDGNLWSAGDPEVRGAIVGIGMRPAGPAGRYTVNYRVTSGDGHVVTGSWSFTLAAAGTGAPGPAVSPADSRNDTQIPLWPFAFGAVMLVAGAGAWALRRQS